jgi:OpgC protein
MVEGSDWKEIMSIASGPSAMERDLRLDFFRGLALFCIFIDHLPTNIMAEFTLQSVMLADAAEVFILISGYTAGMVYGAAMEHQGFSDSRGPRLPAGMAALCCARLSVYDVHRDGGIHSRCPQQLALRRGIRRPQFSQRTWPGCDEGANASVPASVHGHPAARSAFLL